MSQKAQKAIQYSKQVALPRHFEVSSWCNESNYNNMSCNMSLFSLHPRIRWISMGGKFFFFQPCLDSNLRWAFRVDPTGSFATKEVAGLKRHNCDHALALIRFLAGYRSCEGWAGSCEWQRLLHFFSLTNCYFNREKNKCLWVMIQSESCL